MNRVTDVILDLGLWVPTKVVGHFLQPVTAMLDSLAESTEAAIKEYTEEHNS